MLRVKKMHSFILSLLACFVAITRVWAEADTSFVFPLAGLDPGTAKDPNGERFTLGPRQYLAKMSIFPDVADDSAQEIEAQEKDFIIDTGSGVTVTYHVDTATDEECSANFGELNATSLDLSPDESNFTLAQEGSSACKDFIYSLSNSKNSTCPFMIMYAGGVNIQGFVVDNAYVFVDGSKQVLGNSNTDTSSLDEVLTTLNDGVAPLYSPFIFGRIDSAVSCQLYPGVVGMDSTPTAFAPQLVSSGRIGGVVFSICVSREGLYENGQQAGYLVMGPGVPSALEQALSTFPLYNGKTLQRIKTENQEFQDDISSLDVQGLDTHFFVITDSMTIGNDTFQGPLDTLVDTGYTGIAFKSEIISALNTQIASNAANKGYTSDGADCILVGAVSNEDAMALVNDIAPSIQVSLSDTVSFNIEGIDYMRVSNIGTGEYAICNAALVSQSNEPAILGTAFFINRFVQFDWENQQIRIADESSCSDDTVEFTAQTTASDMSGSYSFPFTVESQGVHPPRDTVLSLVAFMLILILLL